MWENMQVIGGVLSFVLIIIRAYWVILSTKARRDHDRAATRSKTGVGLSSGSDGIRRSDSDGVDTE